MKHLQSLSRQLFRRPGPEDACPVPSNTVENHATEATPQIPDIEKNATTDPLK